jgi:hypothetical protein
MPAKDRTGPMGHGPRSGRGLGNCNPIRSDLDQASTAGSKRPFQWGVHFWKAPLEKFIRRRRVNRF